MDTFEQIRANSSTQKNCGPENLSLTQNMLFTPNQFFSDTESDTDQSKIKHYAA